MTEDSPEIPYTLEDHDRLVRMEAEMKLYGKLVGIAVSLSALAVALIATGWHL
jgi:hypothetical protein